MIEQGMKAPDFLLTDKDGKEYSLNDFSGKYLVIYFYPKDNTPGCTRQACAFRNLYADITARGVEVVGISRDSAASHTKFADKYQLPFILLSDPERSAIKAYGVWQEKKLYGKISFGIVRTTFLLDPHGTVVKVWNKVKPDTNAEEILSYLDECGI